VLYVPRGMKYSSTWCLYPQSPPKGGTIPYRPRPGPAGPGGMMMGQGGAGGGYGMQGNYGMNPAEVRQFFQVCMLRVIRVV